MTRPVLPQQRREGDTAQARADRTMADLKAGRRVVQVDHGADHGADHRADRAIDPNDEGEPGPPG